MASGRSDAPGSGAGSPRRAGRRRAAVTALATELSRLLSHPRTRAAYGAAARRRAVATLHCDRIRLVASPAAGDGRVWCLEHDAPLAFAIAAPVSMNIGHMEITPTLQVMGGLQTAKPQTVGYPAATGGSGGKVA